MARLSAQRAVNNFSGGLVTEANELSFPENSLSKAINIEVAADGSCKSRPTFSSLNWSLDVKPYSGLIDISYLKKFYWDHLDTSVIVLIRRNLTWAEFTFLFTKDGNQKIFQFERKDGTSSDEKELQKFFDVGFTEDSIFFPLTYKEAGKDRSVLYRIKTDSELSFFEMSPHYTGRVQPPTEPVREPQVGEAYNRVLGQDTYFRTFLGGAELDDRTYQWWWQGVLVDSREIYDGLPNDVMSVEVGVWTYYRGSFIVSEAGGQYAGVWRVGEAAPIPETPVNSARPISYRDFKGLLNADANGPADRNVESFFRPSEISAHHAYNLYNAGWPLQTDYKYLASAGATSTSTGVTYSAATKAVTSKYPAIADAYYEHLSEAGDPAVLGFYSPSSLAGTPSEFSKPRRGSHILNMGFEYLGLVEDSTAGCFFLPSAFKSGAGNLAHTSEFLSQAEESVEDDVSVTAFSIIGGRAWYGVSGRHFKVAYSQINVDNDFDGSAVGNFCNCYQENDPNAETLNNVLDTDGGTLDLGGIGTIYKISEYRNSILLFADNGIWSISGGDGNSFRPTSFSVDKLSSLGVHSAQAICATELGVFFISDNDLAMVTTNEYGILVVNNLSEIKVLSKMKDVCKEFYNSANAHLIFEEDTKRLLINYNQKPTLLVSGQYVTAPQHFLLGSNKTFVYDTKLNSFYEWELTSNRCFFPDSTTFASIVDGGVWRKHSDGDDFHFDLGLYKTSSGTQALYMQRSLESAGSFAGIIATMRLSQSPNIFAIKSYGRVDNWSSVKDAPHRNIEEHNVQFEIPFDLFGDMSLSKSVQTATFIQSADSSLFSIQSQELRRPKLILKSFWDWENTSKPSQDLYGSLRYPDQLNYNQKKVLINKVKIPGSGRSLSLQFDKPKGQQAGAFKLLGYYLDINSDARP